MLLIIIINVSFCVLHSRDVCFTGVVLIAHPSWLFEQNMEDKGIFPDSDGTDKIGGNDGSTTAAILVALLGAAMAGMAYASVRLVGEQTSSNVMVLYYSFLSIPIALIGSTCFLGKWRLLGDKNFTLRNYFFLFLTGLAGYGGQYFTNLGLQVETAATVRARNVFCSCQDGGLAFS